MSRIVFEVWIARHLLALDNCFEVTVGGFPADFNRIIAGRANYFLSLNDGCVDKGTTDRHTYGFPNSHSFAIARS